MRYAVPLSSSALAAALLLAAVAPPAGGQVDNEITRKTLEGLEGVYVLVEGFEPEAKRAGFDEAKFKTTVEMRLLEGGINVLTQDELLAVPGMPFIYLIVHPGHTRPGQIAPYSIRLELLQMVSLDRDPSTLTPAGTWGTSALGDGDLPYIRAGVKQQVDEFVSAWWSVNKR